jgi:hypothetical protein
MPADETPRRPPPLKQAEPDADHPFRCERCKLWFTKFACGNHDGLGDVPTFICLGCLLPEED